MEYVTQLEELLELNSVSRQLGIQLQCERHVENKAKHVNGLALRLKSMRAHSIMHLQVLQMLFAASTAALGSWQTWIGNISVGEFIAFYLTATKCCGTLTALGSIARLYHGTRASLSLMLGMQGLRPEKHNAETVLPESPSVLELSKVVFAYPGSAIEFSSVGGARPVLQGVNLKIEVGQKIGLLSRSGAGKSTMLKLMSRTYQPQSGCISFDGVPLNRTAVPAWLAIMEQETLLFEGTVEFNVIVGLPRKISKERLNTIYAQAALGKHEFRGGGGFHTHVGPRGSYMSLGQRQRIAFARTLARDCPFVLLDEPVSAQDPNSRGVMARTCGNLTRVGTGAPVTVFATSHLLDFFDAFGRITMGEEDVTRLCPPFIVGVSIS